MFNNKNNYNSIGEKLANKYLKLTILIYSTKRMQG